MKIALNEKQYDLLLSNLPDDQEISEDDSPISTPSSTPSSSTSSSTTSAPTSNVDAKGVSSSGDKVGYPTVSKWSDVVGSKLTRGPGNQIANTKWSDIVGSLISRGAANQLSEQTAPFYDPNGNLQMGGPVSKPNGSIDASELYPNVPIGKLPKKIDRKNFSNNKNQSGIPNALFSNPTLPKDIFRGWKGKPEPKAPTPYNGQILSSSGTKLPPQPWGYYNGVLGNLDQQKKQFESDYDNWQEANDPEGKVNRTRVTTSGEKVPEGFWPSEYNEYLSKVNPLLKQKQAIESKYLETSFGNVASGSGATFRPEKMTSQDKTTYNQITKQIENIKSQYYHKDFRGGISKDNLQSYLAYSSALSEYWSPIIMNCYNKEMNSKAYGDISTTTPKINYTDQNGIMQSHGGQSMSLGSKCMGYETQLRSQINELKRIYGYDMRSGFDKFWDTYGDWVWIGGSILISIAIPGSAAIFAEAGFNLAIAGYQESRGQTVNAKMSILFAALPALNGILRIGQIPKRIASSISEKLAQTTIKTSSDWANFIIKLPKEEQVWFKEFTKTNAAECKNAIGQVVNKSIERAESSGKIISPELKQKINTSLTKRVGKGVGLAKNISKSIGKKIKFKWPAGRRFVFDSVSILTAAQWAQKIERDYWEANHERLGQEEVKKLESYFNSIPKEVKEIYANNITQSQVEEVLNKPLQTAEQYLKIAEQYKNELNSLKKPIKR